MDAVYFRWTLDAHPIHCLDNAADKSISEIRALITHFVLEQPPDFVPHDTQPQIEQFRIEWKSSLNPAIFQIGEISEEAPPTAGSTQLAIGTIAEARLSYPALGSATSPLTVFTTITELYQP